MSTVVVTKPYPFLNQVNFNLCRNQQDPADIITFLGQRNYVPAFLRWELVRKIPEPTAFEGFFVGENKTAEEIALAIAEIGRDQLNSLKHHHNFEACCRMRKYLLEFVSGEVFRNEALIELNAIFGSILAQLRPKLRTNRLAQKFRDDTDRLACTASFKILHNASEVTGQIYTVETRRSLKPPDLSTDPMTFLPKDELREAYRLMKGSGLVGHPLSRWYLNTL